MNHSIGLSVHSGLSGNEIFCLSKKNLTPGNLVIGNSVYSMGVLRSVSSAVRTFVGGEVSEVTRLIADGRQAAYDRMIAEGSRFRAVGITGVSSELVQHPNGIEFLSVGSCIHSNSELQWRGKNFSTSADGQQLYCQLDCGFTPLKFAFGNVAYSMGVGRGILGAIRSIARGEVTEYTEIFSQTRHLAIERIKKEAKEVGANAVIGIETSIAPFMGLQEMTMVGTASHHALLPPEKLSDPITSDLTNEEMWNLVNLGYMPERLLLGVSVYSLGIVGGIVAGLRNLVRGEQTELTELIYEARESAIQKIQKEANECGADQIVGIKTYIYDLGSGLIEFMAIGTAVKKMPELTTDSPNLIPQAVIRDVDTFTNSTEGMRLIDLNTNTQGKPALMAKMGLLRAVIIFFGLLMYLFVLKSKI